MGAPPSGRRRKDRLMSRLRSRKWLLLRTCSPRLTQTPTTGPDASSRPSTAKASRKLPDERALSQLRIQRLGLRSFASTTPGESRPSATEELGHNEDKDGSAKSTSEEEVDERIADGGEQNGDDGDRKQDWHFFLPGL